MFPTVAYSYEVQKFTCFTEDLWKSTLEDDLNEVGWTNYFMLSWYVLVAIAAP